MAALGSGAHRAIIEQVTAHYRDDARVLAVAVFGSVGTGAWHGRSDVDLDIVTGDGVVVRPGDEVAALFGPRAVIVLTWADSADIVLDSLAEVSVRWHPLRATSPNICATVRVVHGGLPDAVLAAAGEANRGRPDEQRDNLRLDPADPAAALSAVLAETQAGYDLGPARRALLDQIAPVPDA
ncbi:MAG TPA: nucleotidyltransferase domain-containing protein [Trebonia sp.]|jgi:predicted nucleotidyltransferase|nr:nucleotidyltransferase domain-containing protein [Trebonia sp.]